MIIHSTFSFNEQISSQTKPFLLKEFKGIDVTNHFSTNPVLILFYRINCQSQEGVKIN